MIPLDGYQTADDTDRIPGDFRRNSQGRPWVSNPDGGRDLLYDRPSAWIGEDYTGINPIYAMRGSFIHELLERIDNEEMM